MEARGAVEAVWRMESARIVGALARYTGDFSLAEDLAEEALAEALVSWSVNGVPAEPAGWLLTTGRRRAIDAFRRRAGRDERYALLARGLDDSTPGAESNSRLPSWSRTRSASTSRLRRPAVNVAGSSPLPSSTAPSSRLGRRTAG